jgi:hypothetical protein
VELVDPFDRVLDGYSREDCLLFSGNETEWQVTWKTATGPGGGSQAGLLEEKMVSVGRGGVKVKVYMDNARLYALYTA